MNRMRSLIGSICLILLTAAPDLLAQTPAISAARVKARKELGQLGVEYSKRSFVKQAAEGDTIAVQLFLAAGMDPNSYDGEAQSNSLMAAAGQGHLETVSALLAGGASAKGNTAVVVATRLDVLTLLLDHGADVNIQRGGTTALMSAAASGDVARTKLLLERGADVNAKGYNGRTILIVAVEAAANIPAGNNVSVYPPATEEAARQRREIVEMLVARKVDIDFKDYQGRTALLIAAQKGAADLVKILLDHGADVNTSDKEQRTALIEAISGGYVDLVKTLVAKGADVNARTHSRTPLSIAAELHKTDIVQLLIAAGAR